MSNPTASPSDATPWLVRIAEVFAPVAGEVLGQLGTVSATRLGSEYYLIKTPAPDAIHSSDAAAFVRWNLPVQHSWPCCPQKTEAFVEKAAQAIFRKFGHLKPQAILIGQLDAGAPHKYYKTLASNLRGRTLQLFPDLLAAKTEPEEQDPSAPTLFCLVGREGLFCGIQSPRAANGFFPGGTKYISQSAPGTISRAGAKIAEALHYLRLHLPPLKKGSHWLELGASPGGMTSELLKRGHQVTAVDRAPLDPRLDRAPGLIFSKADVGVFEPPSGVIYDAILSDLNGSSHESIGHVIRLAGRLRDRGLVVFTLKTTDAETVSAARRLFETVVARAGNSGLVLIAATHLTYNRQEFTLFFEKRQR